MNRGPLCQLCHSHGHWVDHCFCSTGRWVRAAFSTFPMFTWGLSMSIRCRESITQSELSGETECHAQHVRFSKNMQISLRIYVNWFCAKRTSFANQYGKIEQIGKFKFDKWLSRLLLRLCRNFLLSFFAATVATPIHFSSNKVNLELQLSWSSSLWGVFAPNFLLVQKNMASFLKSRLK